MKAEDQILEVLRKQDQMQELLSCIKEEMRNAKEDVQTIKTAQAVLLKSQREL